MPIDHRIVSNQTNIVLAGQYSEYSIAKEIGKTRYITTKRNLAWVVFDCQIDRSSSLKPDPAPECLLLMKASSKIRLLFSVYCGNASVTY